MINMVGYFKRNPWNILALLVFTSGTASADNLFSDSSLYEKRLKEVQDTSRKLKEGASNSTLSDSKSDGSNDEKPAPAGLGTRGGSASGSSSNSTSNASPGARSGGTGPATQDVNPGDVPELLEFPGE